MTFQRSLDDINTNLDVAAVKLRVWRLIREADPFYILEHEGPGFEPQTSVKTRLNSTHFFVDFKKVELGIEKSISSSKYKKVTRYEAKWRGRHRDTDSLPSKAFFEVFV